MTARISGADAPPSEQQAQSPQTAGQQQGPAAAQSPSSPDLARVQAELESALVALGLPDEATRKAAAQQLDRLAQTSASLATLSPLPDDKLAARNLELQAYNTLAQQAQQDAQPAEVNRRVAQMRQTVDDVKQSTDPQAQALGEFWNLQADLVQINQSGQSQDGRQKAAIGRLERFLARPEAVGQNTLGHGITGQAALTLLRLYDQRGMSDKACRLAEQLARDPECEPQVKAALEEGFACCAALGQRFDANLATRDGGTWKSSQHLGRFVLIHFYADWFAPGAEDLEALRAARQRPGNKPALTILSVCVATPAGKAQDQPAAPKAMAGIDWPIYDEGPQQVSLSRMFAVRSLPRYVLLDRLGRVMAIGGSPAILEQIGDTGKPPPAKAAPPNDAPAAP
ncbi:MAG: hypothetical protein WEC36_11455 [Phycisphaeraceae bacterium]